MAGSDNRLKTPVAKSLNQLAGQRAADALQSLSKGIPAKVVSRNGQMVTVSFQMQSSGVGGPWQQINQTYPIGGSSPSDWYPIDAGTLGYLLPSDFYLGGVTGQGGGTADYAQRGNLASLAFFPLGNTAQVPPGGDPEKRCLQGLNGVYLQDNAGTITLTLDKAKGLKIAFQGSNIIIDQNGGIAINSLSQIVLMAPNVIIN